MTRDEEYMLVNKIFGNSEMDDFHIAIHRDAISNMVNEELLNEELSSHIRSFNTRWDTIHYISHEEGDIEFNIESTYEGEDREGDFLYGRLYLSVDGKMHIENSYNEQGSI